MLRAIKQTYADAWTCMRALPMIVGIVIVCEGAQHVIEWVIGFYQSQEAAQIAQQNPVRLMAGALKALSLVAVGYWVCRFLMSPYPTQRIVAGNWTSARRFAGASLAYFLLSLLVILLAFSLRAFGLNQAFLLACASLGALLIRTVLSYWIVGTAVDDPKATFRTSLSLSWGSLRWGMVLIAATYLPPLVVHHLLGLGAIGQPAVPAAVMLALDSIVVGYLGAIIASAQVQIARRVAERSGRVLAAPAVAAE